MNTREGYSFPMKTTMCDTCFHNVITDYGQFYHCRNPYLRDRDDTGGKRYFSEQNRPDYYNCEFYDSIEDGYRREWNEIKQGIAEWY